MSSSVQGDGARCPFQPNHSVIWFPEAADTLQGFSFLQFCCVLWMFAQSIRHEYSLASAPEQGTGVGGSLGQQEASRARRGGVTVG